MKYLQQPSLLNKQIYIYIYPVSLTKMCLSFFATKQYFIILLVLLEVGRSLIK